MCMGPEARASSIQYFGKFCNFALLFSIFKKVIDKIYIEFTNIFSLCVTFYITKIWIYYSIEFGCVKNGILVRTNVFFEYCFFQK